MVILDVLIDANDGITDACKDLGQLDDEFVREASVQQYKLRDMIQFWGLELHELDIMIK